MAAAVKLFRELSDAGKVTQTLMDEGYQASEIGVLAGKKSSVLALVGGQSCDVQIRGKQAVALGALSGLKDEAALGGALGLSQETLDYLLTGVAVGGVVVAVTADGDRAEKAKAILGGVLPDVVCDRPATSPGFVVADRMSASNAADSKLAGDFRKY